MTTPSPPLHVAVLLYPGCIVAEVVEVASRLARSGVEMHWVGLSNATITDQSGAVLTPTTTVNELANKKLDAVIVPGGDPESIMGDDEVHSLIVRTARTGVVGGICGGVLVLADAGVLRNRRATHSFRDPWSPASTERLVAHLFADVSIEADRSVGLVVDNRIVTALPNATAEFSLVICQQLGIYDDRQAELLTRHLQGQFVPELFAESQATPIAAPFQVGPAQSTDIDDLVELQINLFNEDAGVHEPLVDLTWPKLQGRNDFEDLLASESSLVLIATAHSKPIGFLVGYLSPASPARQPVTFAVVRSLYVIADQRSSGAGSALTTLFLDWATANDAAEAHVSAYAANHGAQRFYERHGFISHSMSRARPLPLNSPLG